MGFPALGDPGLFCLFVFFFFFFFVVVLCLLLVGE